VFELGSASGVILVEGVSDRVALETLAARRGRDLAAERVAIVAIGGAQAIGNVLRTIQQRNDETRLAGLCDAGEERDFGRALEQAGLGSDLTRERMEKLGFYVCDADLEHELIRALGAAVVVNVLARNGDLSSFRTFQKQPQWEGRPTEDQLRRFFGSSAGKIKYARLLIEALDLARVPRPLDRVLTHV
jgi:Overcoming lysogenization defect protein-like, TOPRIM domain